MQEAVATRPLVPTWHAPRQHRACETASDRRAARNFGATAREDASRASAERARAADAPRAPSTHGGTPRAGGGRRGCLVNPNGGECGRGGCDTAEASSCREDHVSQQPEKERKRDEKGNAWKRKRCASCRTSPRRKAGAVEVWARSPNKAGGERVQARRAAKAPKPPIARRSETRRQGTERESSEAEKEERRGEARDPR